MASSSSNEYVTVEVGEEYTYPYPSNLSAASFISVKLSDGTFVRPAEASSSSSVSGKEKVGGHQTHWLWTRSDALVKGWILGSLSKETFGYVLEGLTGKLHQEDFSAKDVWDELQILYAPHASPQLPVVEGTEEDQERASDLVKLNNDIQHEIWSWVEHILNVGRVTVIDKITNNGNTALHVAVDGSTLLHVAAIIGNTEAADILMARYPDLLLTEDNEGQTPLALALSNMHKETARHLLEHINSDTQKDALFSGTTGDDLLVTLISSKDFCFAQDLLGHYKTLHTDAVLMAIAKNFPSKVNLYEIYEGYSAPSCTTCCDALADICAPWILSYIIVPLLLAILVIPVFFVFMLGMLVWVFIKERVETHEGAVNLLLGVSSLIKENKHPSSYHHYYTNPILEATRQNAYEFIQIIIWNFPNAILSATEDGHNIIQYAVLNRSENVYNLLYQMSEHRNIYRTIRDSHGNNLLHLAARLAPNNKLNLISGAALQIQRELQWFKEVERFICPLSITQKNSFNETPQTVFTREHKDLVVEGEKWMKSTAESYTITAALIITIVFAAAITVPGGSDQSNGIPIFTNRTAFTVFAISDAISLFSAVTSLLMFLSILTARFAEQDFLYKLPRKLIIGLSTLFISTTAMIVAFAATLYLVFGQSNSRILIPIAVLTCLPITSFVTLQFPLVLDLMSATYGPSIFALLHGFNLYQLIDGTHLLSQPITAADGTVTPHADYPKWFHQDKILFGALVGSLSPQIVPLVTNASSSREAWQTLIGTYASTSQVDELAILGKKLDQQDMIDVVINGLDQSTYKPILDDVHATDSPISLNELHEKLINHELTLAQQISSPNLHQLVITFYANHQPHRKSWPTRQGKP
ncbi:unnamed protein product [Lactuca saligna]|uniref:PGG domain-containing protein n=1 Tax=Lactuca saligna TaxID=75948 RepID=A0AA35ZIG2_LACSI|nr:unnamed protein product [Lactuca saligna]